jgi:hypothetical protein
LYATRSQSLVEAPGTCSVNSADRTSTPGWASEIICVSSDAVMSSTRVGSGVAAAGGAVLRSAI